MERSTGFVDAHSHLRSTPLAEHGVAGSCLEEAILRMNAMTAVDIEDDTFVATSELLLAGVTGVQFIFHTFGPPEFYLETLDRALSGIARSGIRAQVILGITDQFEFLPENPKTKIDLPGFVGTGKRISPEEFIEIHRSATNKYPHLQLGVGPVGPQWCSDSMMMAVQEIAEGGVRVHTHCLESSRQRDWISEPLVERLNRFGLLGDRTSLAHAIWLTDDELELVKATGTHLVTCPSSNRYLKAGVADTAKWISQGISFGVGLDSLSGRESPLATAKLSLSESDGIVALTTGGMEAAGIDTSHDSVTWQDWQESRAREVLVDGQQLVQEGRHAKQAELDEAIERISAKMASDKAARELRQGILTQIMERYLQSIS